MKRFIVLLRGINVGGKNNIPMAALRACLEAEGCRDVTTYIQSGNVLLSSSLSAAALAHKIETALSKTFKLDSSIIRVLALTPGELRAIVDARPAGFGDHPDIYHSDVIFLMGVSLPEALAVFKPRDGVDRIWPGKNVIYSQRLSAERTKSRLGQIVGTVPYKSMTIRSWSTVMKLLALANRSSDKAKAAMPQDKDQT